MRVVLRLLGAAFAGTALLAAMERLGWIQAHAVLSFLIEFLDLRLLGFVLWPFTWIDLAGVGITEGERAAILPVWAVLIAPVLRNIDVVAQHPELPMERLAFLWRLPMALFVGAGLAFLLGLVCFLLPTALSRFLLFGWLGVILGANVLLSLRILFSAPKPDASPVLVANARATVGILWMAYAETALGALAVVAIDWLTRDGTLAAMAEAALRDLLRSAPPPAPTVFPGGR